MKDAVLALWAIPTVCGVMFLAACLAVYGRDHWRTFRARPGFMQSDYLELVERGWKS